MQSQIQIVVWYFTIIWKVSGRVPILTQIICRHGDRSPEWIPNSVLHKWTTQPGHLTSTGMLQAHQIGRFLKKKYLDNLRLVEYNPKSVKFFSTSTDRTRQTALIIGAAMYDNQSRPNKVASYPLPYTTHEFDINVDFSKHCPKYHSFLKNMLYSSENSAFISEFNSNYSSTLDFLSDHFKMKLKFTDLYKIYDFVSIERLHGHERSEINDTTFLFLRNSSMTSLQRLIDKRHMSAVRFTKGFRSIFDNMELKINKAISSSFMLYTAHDVTIHGFIYWLTGKMPRSFVGYVSFLSFELYENEEDSTFEVKILFFPGTYLTTFNIQMYDLTGAICQNKNLCTIDELKEKLSDVLDVNYESVCNRCSHLNTMLIVIMICSMVITISL